jgi:2-oxoglutarate ferredoxin oxidoreductase subunit delta
MFKILIIDDYCKECGICVEFCPVKILRIGDKINTFKYHVVEVTDEDKCIGCMLCERYCPDFAIYVEERR